MAPYDKELRLRLAKKLIRGGRLEEALEEIRAVIRLDSNNLPARELRLAVNERLSARLDDSAAGVSGPCAS